MENKVTLEPLAESIVFQEKSIVSKIVLKKANGNITLFAFDTDEALSEHTSPYEAVVYLLAGCMKITIDGIAYQVQAGDYIILPAGVPHALLAIEPAKMLLTMIK